MKTVSYNHIPWTKLSAQYMVINSVGSFAITLFILPGYLASESRREYLSLHCAVTGYLLAYPNLENMAIKRVWHGWTTPENADSYQALLHNTVFPRIEERRIPGYMGIELLRRDLADEVEFITIMTFQSLQNVIDFQGEAYTRSYVPEEAQRVLKRWDQHASHYDVVESRTYNKGE